MSSTLDFDELEERKPIDKPGERERRRSNIAEFGHHVTRWRLALHLTQVQAATELGVTATVIAAWETGVYAPRKLHQRMVRLAMSAVFHNQLPYGIAQQDREMTMHPVLMRSFYRNKLPDATRKLIDPMWTGKKPKSDKRFDANQKVVTSVDDNFTVVRYKDLEK